VPGFPHFGHTANVAWSVTHAFVDIHDLYVEKFRRPARETIASKDAVLPATHRAETIKVRDGEDVTIDVVETQHGPIIAGDPAQGYCPCLEVGAVRRSRYIVRLHAAHVARAIGRAII